MMELKFLGRGGAFNIAEKNNSCYFISDNNLFLIDSGETVFATLENKKLLNLGHELYVFITHCHTDHIGSLTSVVFYNFFLNKKKTKIVFGKGMPHKQSVLDYLRITGVTEEMFELVEDDKLSCSAFKKVFYFETKHCDEIESSGLIFETKDGLVYYSGDTCSTDIIENLNNKPNKVDKIYIDTTNANYTGSIHLYIGRLKEVISKELLAKTWCMHFNNEECIKEAKKLGFNVVEVE